MGIHSITQPFSGKIVSPVQPFGTSSANLRPFWYHIYSNICKMIDIISLKILKLHYHSSTLKLLIFSCLFYDIFKINKIMNMNSFKYF